MPSLNDIDFNERERRALQGADKLNAYLSMSSIPEAAAAAQQRARQQELERRRRQESMDLGASMAFKRGENALDRQNALDRIAAAEKAGAWGNYSPATQAKLVENAATADALGEAADMGEKAGEFKGNRELLVEGARWLFGDTAANTVAEMAYDEAQRQVRTAVGNAVGNWRRNLTGANVTGIEVVLGENWDPDAKGISGAESVRRMRQLEQFINSKQNVYGVPPINGNRDAPTAAPKPGGLSPSAQKYIVR